MRNSIENNIDKNRDAFDNDVPDSNVWENIHRELHPEEKKKAFPWLKIAALFAIILTTVWYIGYKKNPNEESIAQVETTVDTTYVDSNFRKVIRGGNWKDIDYYLQNGNKSYLGYRNVNTQIGRSKTVTVDQFYMDQTEITNNEYRDFVNVVREKIANNEYRAYRGNVFKTKELEKTLNVTNSGSVVTIEVPDQTLFTATGSYNLSVTNANTSISEQSYGFTQDLNPNVQYQANSTVTATTYNWSFGDGKMNQQLIDQTQVDPGYYYEQYDQFEENKYIKTVTEAVSTFGIDVDAAGYSNMRRYISEGYLPPKDAVKLEEMINYFDYKLPQPKNDRPFAVTTELGKCPWNPKNNLLKVCLQGKIIPQEKYPASNLVFLLDVSGSMQDANKLPLLKQGFKMLIEQLREEDRVSIVVYAGAAGVVLPSTSGKNKDKIEEAIDNLYAGGSTAGGEGIMLAYDIAKKNFIKNGNNRIILATDGDFNVGVSDDNALIRLVEEKRKSGVFLSVLGFGEGNLQSSKMEKIADNGNGNYAYIDNILEAKKVLVTEMGGTLHTIAKDVKMQLEFNPQVVESYRLLGYENRMLATEDFDNDLKDAGDLGSGHSVIALYEIVPADGKEKSTASNLKYQKNIFVDDAKLKNEMVTLKLRYKKPNESKSKLITYVVKNDVKEKVTDNFKFASAVAEFGLLIRDSQYKGDANFDKLIERAKESKGEDANGYRAEFIKLAEQGQLLFEEFHAKKKVK